MRLRHTTPFDLLQVLDEGQHRFGGADFIAALERHVQVFLLRVELLVLLEHRVVGVALLLLLDLVDAGLVHSLKLFF